MIFRHTKNLLLSTLLFSLLVGNISVFAAPKQADLDTQLYDTTAKKTENKPSTNEIADSISENTTVDNTLLIKVRDGEDATDVKNELKNEISGKLKIDKKNIKDFDASDDQVVALQFDDVNKLKDGFKVATNNSKVEVAQPNYKYKKMYTPNDTEFNSQWYLKNQPSGTNTQAGWDAVGTKAGVTCGDANANAKRCGGENSVKIAVIDSGVNLAVIDFAGAPVDVGNSMRFFNNPNGAACPVNQTYLPANGLIVGWQFCQSIGTQFDEDGHGTGVASVIMSQDNATGSVGIAHNTTLLPIALHNDTFNTFFISEAIRYAQNRGAKVINLSLGTPYYDSFLESTINAAVNAGVTVVAATGNCAVFEVRSCDWDGSGTQNQPEETNNTPMYPAAFASVIAVGASNYATTAGGVTRSCYSNYGNHIDIVAPVGDTGSSCNPSGGPSQSGVRIPCGVVRLGCATVDTFISGAGTSYAAPMVAGSVGLLLSSYPNITPAGVMSIIQNRSTDIGIAGKDDKFGNGLLNLSSFAIPNPSITSVKSDFNIFRGNIYSFVNDASFDTYNYKYSNSVWLSQTPVSLLGDQTNLSYSTIIDRDYLNLFYADKNTNEIKYKYTTDAVKWSATQNTGLFTQKSFVAVNHLNTYNAFYVASDNKVHTKYFSGGAWLQDRIIPTPNNVSQVFALVDGEYINLFYLDSVTNQVTYIYTRNGTWSNPIPLTGLTTTKKFFIVNHLGTYNAYYVDLDNSLKRIWYNGKNWVDKQIIAGETNIVDVSGFVEKDYINLAFIRSNDNIPRYRYTNNGQWSNPTEIR
jgi:hypothetical protein